MKLRKSGFGDLQAAADRRSSMDTARADDAARLIRLAVERYRRRPTPANHRTIGYYVGLLTRIVDRDGATNTARTFERRTRGVHG